jgi:two-component system, cell cycle response regulator DivK
VTPHSPDALVLIVDDNERNRKLARDVLRADGFRTVEAASGAEAIALAVGQMPDVILMDLRLPDMDGAEAARKLGADARTARIPVVALSALQVDAESLSAAGLTGCLEKPISVRDFPQQVRGYCAGG